MTNHLVNLESKGSDYTGKVHTSDRHLCDKDTTQTAANWNIARRVCRQACFQKPGHDRISLQLSKVELISNWPRPAESFFGSDSHLVGERFRFIC